METLSEILRKIESDYQNHQIDLDDLRRINKFCEKLIEKEELKMRKEIFENLDFSQFNKVIFDVSAFETDPSIDFPPGAPEPASFINEFTNRFDTAYHVTTRIYKEVADELFSDPNTNEVTIVLGQINDDIIFCVKKSGGLYRIDENKNLVTVSEDAVSDFNVGFGNNLDIYLRSKLGIVSARNTRKFKMTRNVYEELVNCGQEAILFFPAIVMDQDTHNPDNVSYRYRYTYMMTFGKATGNYPATSSFLIFDRNGLCPPGDC